MYPRATTAEKRPGSSAVGSVPDVRPRAFGRGPRRAVPGRATMQPLAVPAAAWREAESMATDRVRVLAVADGALRGAGGRPNVLVRYADGNHGEFV